MVTQKQIARKLGISQSAVAFAFHPTLHAHLSTHKRQHILDTAERLGYQPHHAARRLIRRRFRTPAPQFDQAGLLYFGGRAQYLDPVCLAMILGAEHEFSKHQASFVFVNAGLPGGWDKVERMSRSSGVDGWLVYGAVTDEMAIQLKACRLPFVIIGDHRCTQPVNCVRIDNVAVGRLAAEHLAARGHRRVAYLRGGNDGFVYQLEILAGFRAAVRELRMDQDEGLTLPPSKWVGKEIIEWMQNANPKPTAMFASELDLAAGVAHVLKDAGFSVPGDISMLGTELVLPSPTPKGISRIELPITEVGRQGAALLHKIAADPGETPCEVKIAPALVEEGSVAAPRSQKV